MKYWIGAAVVVIASAGDDHRGTREPMAVKSARFTHPFILHTAGDTVMTDSIS